MDYRIQNRILYDLYSLPYAESSLKEIHVKDVFLYLIICTQPYLICLNTFFERITD